MPFSHSPPGQPLASKRQSPFHQRSPHGLSPLSFIHIVFLFTCFSLLHFSFWFCFHRCSPSRSSAFLSVVHRGGGCIHSSASVCADECWFKRRMQHPCEGFTSGVLACRSAMMFVWCIRSHVRVTRCTRMAAEKNVGSSSAVVMG